MGWGDEIIASGQARALYKQTGKPVQIVDKHGVARYHDAWLNNPHVADRASRQPHHPRLKNAPGYRPYIQDKFESKWVWKNFECQLGEIYFSEAEALWASRYSPQVIIEPNLKAKASPNKDWGRENWQTLAQMLVAKGFRVYQLGPAGTKTVSCAKLIETSTMRQACAVLSRAQFAILPEGGLHHSAAALGTPSVVIYGGFISPKQTGYKTQTNLFTGGEPCGSRLPCPHCTKAMLAITPAMVFSEFEKLVEGKSGNS